MSTNIATVDDLPMLSLGEAEAKSKFLQTNTGRFRRYRVERLVLTRSGKLRTKFYSVRAASGAAALQIADKRKYDDEVKAGHHRDNAK